MKTAKVPLMSPFLPVLFLIAIASAGGVRAAEVEIKVDAAKTHQTIEGFGATTTPLVGPDGSPLPPELRKKMLEAAYGQVKLTMGNLEMSPSEKSAEGRLQNDNDDAKTIHWPGFDLGRAEAMKKYVVDPAAALGLTNYALAKVTWRYQAPWLKDLFEKDREHALDEAAEQAEVSVRHWQKMTGAAPRLLHLLNEPSSGNKELMPADAVAIRDLVKRVGSRLRAAGFKDVMLVVPSEETVVHSTKVARIILEAPEARQYVAAVGYHCYPHSSPYADIAKVLAASGSGAPDARSIRERRELRDLCRQYKVPAWMTEICDHKEEPRVFEHLRARAIHIHDEMVYTDAAAFYGMNTFCDKAGHEAHYAGRKHTPYLSQQDSIVLADNDTGEVTISGMGRAIGHYARWLSRGAIRLEATSGDPLVQVTAFRDDKTKRLVLVVINNAAEAKTVNVTLSGLTVKGPVVGEQSTEKAYWQTLKESGLGGPDRMRIDVPALSVTSLAAALLVE